MERIRYDLDPNSSDTDICDDVLYCPVCDSESDRHAERVAAKQLEVIGRVTGPAMIAQ